MCDGAALEEARRRLDVVNALAGSPPPGQAAWTHENLLEVMAERDRLRAWLAEILRYDGEEYPEDWTAAFDSIMAMVKDALAGNALSNPTATTEDH